MSDSRAVEILDRQQQLEMDRSTFDVHYREIAERILPRQNDFQTKNYTEGQKRTEKIFDSTAVLALDRAASAIDSLITPQTQQYHSLDPEDEDLMGDHQVRLYLDEVNKILFRLRYRPSANFASQSHECYISLMAFGTLGQFVDDALGIGLRYKSIPMSELYIAENHAGVVDYVHRKFPMSARAALQKWGNALPEAIIKAAEKTPFQKFDFIHCVKPNEEIKHGRKDHRGMPVSSYYICVDGKKTLSESGYRVMPYQVSRHVTAPREVYGRSPAMMVLPDIKMINEIEKTTIRAAQKIVDPPLLAYGDGILTAFDTRPNAINYGGVDDQGRQLVHPLKVGSNLPIALDIAEQKRKLINDAFYVTLFQILVQNPQMTATEALIRAQEKGQLLAPTVGRQQSEYLGPQIVRELDIASAANLLPPMPKQLRDRGGVIKITYTSPLSRLRRAEDGVAILRTLESIAPIANVDPTVMDIFDSEAVVRELADINGVPAKLIRSPEAIAAKRQGDAEARQTADVLAGAETAAGAAKNLAQAASTAGFVEPAVAG